MAILYNVGKVNIFAVLHLCQEIEKEEEGGGEGGKREDNSSFLVTYHVLLDKANVLHKS